MKFLIALIFASSFAFADSIGIRKALGTPLVLDTSGTNVTSSAYVQLVASTAYACSAIQIHNTGSQPIKMAVGGSGAEVDNGILFPIGVSIMVPVNQAKAVRLSVKSLGGTQSSGFLTLSCFQ